MKRKILYRRRASIEVESGDFSKSQSFYTGQELGIFPSPGASIEVIFHILSHIFQIFLHIFTYFFIFSTYSHIFLHIYHIFSHSIEKYEKIMKENEGNMKELWNIMREFVKNMKGYVRNMKKNEENMKKISPYTWAVGLGKFPVGGRGERYAYRGHGHNSWDGSQYRKGRQVSRQKKKNPETYD